MPTSQAEFDVSETHGIHRRLGHDVIASSDGLGWHSVYVSLQTENPYHATFAGVRDHLIVLHLSGVTQVGFAADGEKDQQMVPPGCMSIIAGGHDFDADIGNRLSTLHLYVRDSLLRAAAENAGMANAEEIEVISQIGIRDPLIEGLALAIQEAMQKPGPMVPAYVEQLAATIASQLLYRYSTVAARDDAEAGGLSRSQLRRVFDYVERSLDGDVTAEAMAGTVSLSATHFARRFKRSTGLAPYKYVIRARVARARTLLRDVDIPLAQIAYDCGFCHQEHFTRVFGKMVGETPAVYRRRLHLS